MIWALLYIAVGGIILLGLGLLAGYIKSRVEEKPWGEEIDNGK